MIEKWKSRLAKHGFTPDPEHPYAAVSVRRVRFLDLSVSEVKLRWSYLLMIFLDGLSQ